MSEAPWFKVECLQIWANSVQASTVELKNSSTWELLHRTQSSDYQNAHWQATDFVNNKSKQIFCQGPLRGEQARWSLGQVYTFYFVAHRLWTCRTWSPWRDGCYSKYDPSPAQSPTSPPEVADAALEMVLPFWSGCALTQLYTDTTFLLVGLTEPDRESPMPFCLAQLNSLYTAFLLFAK